MTEFEKTKKDTLQRLFVLRIMNALGMIAWRDDRYGGAEQRLRMLHPLSWLWLIVGVLFAVVIHIAVEVAKGVKTTWRDDCVWW